MAKPCSFCGLPLERHTLVGCRVELAMIAKESARLAKLSSASAADLGVKLSIALEALKSMRCTCSNPEPHDWPHDPGNAECNFSMACAAVDEIASVKTKEIERVEDVS